MEKRACMVCTTPFQIICCINIVKNQGLNADLYVVNRFNNSKRVADEIREQGLFKHVFFINSDDYLTEYGHKHFKQRMALLSTYHNIGNIGDSIIGTREYEQVFVSNNAVICRLVYMYLKKKNPDTELIFFDDGIGTYYGHTTTEASLIEKIYRGLLVSPRLYNIAAKYALFNPELFLKKHPYINSRDVAQLPPLEIDTYNQKIIDKVFGIDSSVVIRKKIIILDTLREVEFNSDGCKKIGEIYDSICEKYKDDYIVKPHPKNFSYSSKMRRVQNVTAPLECYCFFNDLADKILITNASFSAFTPKLLFDQEPTIIFTYKIMKDYFVDKDVRMEEGIQDLKCSYREAEKVYIPNKISDLWTILDNEMKKG